MGEQATNKKVATRAGVTRRTPQEVFAAGLSFRKLFFIFLVCSVLGSLYEELLYMFLIYRDQHVLVWSLRRGVIYGPFNVIYGFGAALMCWALLRKPYKDWQIFGLAAVIGGVVEYMLSFLQEAFTGTTSWDYSDLPLSLNGRTTLLFMVLWGFMGLILVKVVYPFLSKLIEKIPVRIGEVLFRVLLVFMILDMLISWTAILRQNLRHQGVPPFTPVGELYDKVYNDDYLRKYFPNMVRSDGQ